MTKTKGFLLAVAVAAMAFTHVFAQEGQYEQQYQQGYPPPQQQGYPPPQQGYPPQYQQGYPPPQQGYPPQYQQGYPPQQQGYQPQYQQGYQPPQQNASQQQKVDNPKRTRFFISPKYQLPAGTPVPWGGFTLGLGWILKSGMLWGFDIDWGYWEKEEDDSFSRCDAVSCKKGLAAGAGFSLGNSHDLPKRFLLSYGGTIGYWFSQERKLSESSGVDVFTDTEGYNFFAPFFKARWRFLEISYKFFLGLSKAEAKAMSGRYSSEEESGYEFGINMHQFAIGFAFGRL